MGAHVAEKVYWLVQKQSPLPCRPDNPRTNSWTPVNHPGKIASMLSTEAPHPCHDRVQVEVQSSQASNFRSTILASAERMKWPTGPRKRKKSPSQSPTHRRKKARVGATNLKVAVPRRIAETSESEASPLKTRSTALNNAEDSVALSNPVLLPWDSNEQNANISKKRIASKVFSRQETEPPSLVVDGPDEQKKIDPVDEQTTDLQTPNENFDDVFLDSPEDVEDFLEVEKQLTATLSQPANPSSQQRWQTSSGMAAPPKRSNFGLWLQTHGDSLPMKPFMRETFQSPPPSARLTETPTFVGFSPLKRTPTCFRIAEALRLLNSADPSHNITFELFAVLRPTSCTVVADETPNHAIEISDLFFPHLPPVLRLNIDPSLIHSLRQCHSTTASQSVHLNQQDANEQTPKNIIRVIIKAWPQTTPPSRPTPTSVGTAVREKFEIRIIHLRPATWEEIKATLTLIEVPYDHAEDFSYGKRE